VCVCVCVCLCSIGVYIYYDLLYEHKHNVTYQVHCAGNSLDKASYCEQVSTS